MVISLGKHKKAFSISEGFWKTTDLGCLVLVSASVCHYVTVLFTLQGPIAFLQCLSTLSHAFILFLSHLPSGVFL